MREKYYTWQDWAVDEEPIKKLEPAKPVSTTRNNSILTGPTGDSTETNVRRRQLQDAKKRKTLLGG